MTEIKFTKAEQKLADACTTLQQKYVINLLDGMTQRQAYYAAGGTAEKNKTADAMASRMLTDEKVRAFYTMLRDKKGIAAILSRDDVLSMYSEDAVHSVNKSDRHRALKAIRDMEGLDQPKKVKHSGSVEVTTVKRTIVE